MNSSWEYIDILNYSEKGDKRGRKEGVRGITGREFVNDVMWEVVWNMNKQFLGVY